MVRGVVACGKYLAPVTKSGSDHPKKTPQARKPASRDNQMLGLGNRKSVKTNWKIKSDEHDGT